MFIRSDTKVFDEALCAAQGYLGAMAINRLYGVVLLNPLHSAICLAGVALTEKIFRAKLCRFVPGYYNSFIGPIPTGKKSIVSYGLATATTLKVMQVAGLIVAVPKAVIAVGLVCAAAVALGALRVGYTRFQHYRAESRPLDVRLREFANLTVFSQKIFEIPHDGTTYRVNILRNPEGSAVQFFHGFSAHSKQRYVIAPENALPQAVIDMLHTVFPKDNTTHIYRHDQELNDESYFECLKQAWEVRSK